MTGSHYDINVLHRSSVFSKLVEGNALVGYYGINGNACDKPYYLAGGIYPSWAIIVRRFMILKQRKLRGSRKDVEWAFDVLQTLWAIIRHLARTWNLQTM
jgi:hypothetical protein